MTRSRPILSVVLALGLASTLAVPAAANSYSYKDKRDVSTGSALDFVSVRTGHKGGKLLHAATLERKITPRGLQETASFIDFLVSTNGSKIDRRIYILGGSRFHVYVTDGSAETLLGRGKAYRPNAKTVGAIVSPGLLGDPDGYYWFAVAVSNSGGQVDYAPNDPTKRTLIHDLTAPIVDSVTLGDGASTAVPGSTLPIVWHGTDTGFGGFRAWTVRQRIDGDTAWSDVDGDTFGIKPRIIDTTKTAIFSGTEGTTYEACVSVSDWANNRSASAPFPVSIPYDDANGSVFSYSVAPDQTLGDANDFEGTASGVTSDGDQITITVPFGLQHYLVLPSGFDGTADITVNGQPASSIDESAITQDRHLVEITSADWASSGTDTIVLTKTGGTVLAVDGYLGAPAYDGSVAFGGCGGAPTAARAGSALGSAAATRPIATEVTSVTAFGDV